MHSAGSAPAINVETARTSGPPRLSRSLSRLLFWRSPEAGEGPAAGRSAYLPGLDGLRALSVIAVLIYHARPEWLPGGFLGVEVFFVISGFIITRALLHEWRDSGRIGLAAFWMRRARRLLPAVGLLLAGVLAYVAAFQPDEVASLRMDALAALAYVTNWQLILGDQSYFDSFQRPSMLRHLWSLAVEEQFYIVWPLVLGFGLPILKQKGLAILIIAGIAASAIGMALLYDPAGDNSRAYFGTDTRAAGLLVGALLAFVMVANQGRDFGPWGRRACLLLGVVALAGLVGTSFWLDESKAFLYQGGFLTVSLVSAVVILAATQRNLLASVLAVRPLRWVGVRSYGIYLWHWPIYMLAWPREATLTEVALQIAAVVVIAAASYSLLEAPIRQGALGRAWQRARAWSVQSWRFRSAIVFSGTSTAAVVFSLVAVAALAKPPELPPYFQTGSIRIQSAVIAQDVGSVVRGPTLMGRVQTTISALTTDERTCPSDNLSPNGSLVGVSSTAFGSTCPQPVTLFQKPPASELADADIIVMGPMATEEEMGAFFAANQPELETAGVVGADDGPAAVVETPVATEPSATSGGGSGTQAPVISEPPPAVPSATSPAQMPSITAIGDSVMLGAAYTLAGSIPGLDLDASVGRQASSAIGLVQQKAAAGVLGEVVVLHIGNNGTLTNEQFDQLMAAIGPDRRVVVLNLHVPRTWEESNNAVISNGVSRYANAVLIDWAAAGNAYPQVLYNDGIHLTPGGATYYTQLVMAAIGEG